MSGARSRSPTPGGVPMLEAGTPPRSRGTRSIESSPSGAEQSRSGRGTPPKRALAFSPAGTPGDGEHDPSVGGGVRAEGGSRGLKSPRGAAHVDQTDVGHESAVVGRSSGAHGEAGATAPAEGASQSANGAVDQESAGALGVVRPTSPRSVAQPVGPAASVMPLQRAEGVAGAGSRPPSAGVTGALVFPLTSLGSHEQSGVDPSGGPDGF